MVHTDNNPLVYVKTSKLGAVQICWLSELTLYDLNIVYRMGKSNLVADALSQRPESMDQVNSGKSQDSDEKWEAVSYPVTNMGSIPEDCVIIPNQVFSREITSIVGGTKIGADLWEHIKLEGSTHENLGEMELIEICSNLVDIFSHITPKEMAEFQQAD